MHIRSFLLAAAAATVLGAGFAAPANASAGDWQVRLRALGVMPDASGTLKIGGATVAGHFSGTNSLVPEVDVTYFITNNWAAEVIAATTQNSVHHSGVGDLGSVWLLPPTVTLQYHFMPNAKIRPYVGAGINYTFFYSTRSPLAGIHYKNNLGFALQAGVDIPMFAPGYFVNLDVKKLFLSTDVKALGGAVRANGVHLNPWLVGVGVGYRF